MNLGTQKAEDGNSFKVPVLYPGIDGLCIYSCTRDNWGVDSSTNLVFWGFRARLHCEDQADSLSSAPCARKNSPVIFSVF